MKIRKQETIQQQQQQQQQQQHQQEQEQRTHSEPVAGCSSASDDVKKTAHRDMTMDPVRTDSRTGPPLSPTTTVPSPPSPHSRPQKRRKLAGAELALHCITNPLITAEGQSSVPKLDVDTLALCDFDSLHTMTDCYSKLMDLVPSIPKHRRIKKVDLLQHVIDYIQDLQSSLDEQDIPVPPMPVELLQQVVSRKPLGEVNRDDTCQKIPKGSSASRTSQPTRRRDLGGTT